MRPWWAPVLDLAERGHVHLDELVKAAPAPGSLRWLPIINELAEHLVEAGDSWTITLPIGRLAAPEQLMSLEDLASSAAVDQLLEPPAVYRVAATTDVSTYDGEVRLLSERRRADGVVERITASRSCRDAAAGEPWSIGAALVVGSAL